MTLTGSQSTVNVQLTPMQLPEGNPITAVADASGWQWEGSNSEVQASSLRLSPEEPSEMLVQVVNTGDRSLSLELVLSADFPPSWCHWRAGGGQGMEHDRAAPGESLVYRGLAPGDRLTAVLYFDLSQTLDAQFFERRDALQPGTALSINYRAQIQIYRLEDNTLGDRTLDERMPDGDRPAREANSRATPNSRARPTTAYRPLVSSSNFNLYLRPHSLYPSFLPAIYREVDFIGRLLKIFEQSFEPSVETLQTLWAYLDPKTAPETLLPFLAHWVGWPSQVPWSLAQQRRLIGRAMEIYRWRGTQRGLKLYLHLYTGLPIQDSQGQPDPRYIEIRESFQRGFTLGEARLGSGAMLGGGKPFHFEVYLRSPQPEQLNERLIRQIIDQERPAFCTYSLAIAPLARGLPPPPPSSILS